MLDVSQQPIALPQVLHCARLPRRVFAPIFNGSPMKIGIASDLTGGVLKAALIPHIEQLGHHVTDFGCSSDDGTDNEALVRRTANAVLDKQVATAVLISRTGISTCIAANKVQGIRAAMCNDHERVVRSRTENQANVMCVSCDKVDTQLSRTLVESWLRSNAG